MPEYAGLIKYPTGSDTYGGGKEPQWWKDLAVTVLAQINSSAASGYRTHTSGTFNADNVEDGTDLVHLAVTQSGTPDQGTWWITTATIAGTARMQVAVSYGAAPRVMRRFRGSGGWSGWERTDAGAIDLSGLGGGGSGASPAAVKTVPLALTAGGSAAAGPTSGVFRMPIRFGATITRWRAHFRNINPRFGTDGPSVSLPSVHFGKATSGQFTETSTRVGSASISTDTAGVATAWQSTPIEAGVEYALSYELSGTATNRVIGGGWSASSVNSPTATLSRTDRMPLDVWIEAEVAPDVPVIAVFGDSLAVGVGATLPVYDSWLSQWARANGALPVHYATSGDTMAGWADSNAFKWQRWQGLTRPDAVIHAMGNNDVFGGADLSTMRTRRTASIEQLRQLVSPVIYTATITPRTSSTGAQEDIRRQYNIWLKLFPDAARAVFDFVPAISSDDENISPGFDADGIHLNTAGYAAVAGAITGPLTPPKTPTLTLISTGIYGTNGTPVSTGIYQIGA